MAEQISITVIDGCVDRAAALEIVASLDTAAQVEVERLLYYPYQRFSATGCVPGLFANRDVESECLVDAINGVAATSDDFETREVEAESADVLEPQVAHSAARKSARRYVSHSLGRNSKSIADFMVAVVEAGVVYKAFWMVRSGRQRFIVDSATGYLHTIRKVA